jgi:hypothetical protein
MIVEGAGTKKMYEKQQVRVSLINKSWLAVVLNDGGTRLVGQL